MNSSVRLAVSSATSVHTGYFQSEVLRLSLPMLDPWVAWSVLLPSCSSQFICTQMWDSPLHQLPPCCELSPPQLPVSAPPTSLGECFFFNSLVVRLPYSSIFGSPCYFLFLNLLFFFFWLCDVTKCIYLYLYLGHKSVLFSTYFFVSSFLQPFCVCLYVLSRAVTSPGLGRMALSSRCPVGYSGTASHSTELVTVGTPLAPTLVWAMCTVLLY